MSSLIDPKRNEKLIKGAGTAGISFAFGMGDSPGTSVLAVDKSKSGKSLLQLCKEEGGAKKGSFGTVRYINGSAILDCEKDELSDLVKSMLGYLRYNKIGLKVELIDETPTEDHKEKQNKSEQEEEEHHGDSEDIPANKMLDAASIIPLILKAKKKILPFSFGIGPDISLMAVHPKKSPTQLAKILRQEGVKKGVWGEVKTDGKTAVFTCESKPFSSLKNEIKAWLADNKQTLKFRIEGPDGYVDEDKDGDGDGDDNANPKDSVPDFVRSELTSLKPKLMEAIAKQPGRKAELQTLWKLAEDAGKSGNRQKAETLIAKLATSAAEALSPQRSDLAGVIAAWISERSAAVSNIGIFSDKVREAYKYDHEHKEQVNAILKKLGSLQEKINRGLVGEMDEIKRSSSPENTNRLKKAVSEFLHAIRSDDLLDSLDDSVIWPSARIASRLIKETENLHSAL